MAGSHLNGVYNSKNVVQLFKTCAKYPFIPLFFMSLFGIDLDFRIFSLKIVWSSGISHPDFSIKFVNNSLYNCQT